MLIIVLLALNLWLFLLFGWDKRASTKDQHRISERTLLLLAFLGGAIGGLLATYFFRHKTKKTPFRWFLWLAAIVNVLIGTAFYLIEINA